MAQQKALFLQTPHPRAFNVIIPESEYPATLGLESAGTVEAVGDGVRGFREGDNVLHQGHFTNEKGTYQQYTIVPADITAKLPSNISFDEAASVSIGLGTAAVGLYGDRPSGFQKFTPAWEEGGKGLYSGQPIVVIGGSTSVGQYVIQLAKLSGFSPIITTASLHNAALLHSLGATHVVDRSGSAAEVSAKITEHLGSTTRATLIFDTISEKETQTLSWELLAPGGALVLLLTPQVDEAKYKDKAVVPINGGLQLPNTHALGVSLYSKLTDLLADGSIKPNRVEVLPGGLAGIPDGLKRLQNGKISGKKLIARPLETA